MMSEAESLVAAYSAICGHPAKLRIPSEAGSEAKALIFAPHPDDESIIGALPLRLQREAGLRVAVVPVTLGSKPERRAERKAELQAACAVLGFLVVDPAAQSFTEVQPDTRSSQPIYWDGLVGKIAALLQREQPQIIFVPHRLDGHATHIGTHHLVMDALAKMPDDFTTQLVFTEFWHPQQEPNLLVETSPEDLTQLLAALLCHQGEIARNPYHRTLPAWMIDNVRRGAELVGGFGAEAPSMAFATLYQIGVWQHGRYQTAVVNRMVPSDHSIAAVLEREAI